MSDRCRPGAEGRPRIDRQKIARRDKGVPGNISDGQRRGDRGGIQGAQICRERAVAANRYGHGMKAVAERRRAGFVVKARYGKRDRIEIGDADNRRTAGDHKGRCDVRIDVEDKSQRCRAGLTGRVCLACHDCVRTIGEARRRVPPIAESIGGHGCRERRAVDCEMDRRVGIARAGQRRVARDPVGIGDAGIVDQALGYRRRRLRH